MIIKHRIQYADGDIDTATMKLSCGANKKYGKVQLCFDCNMSIGFAPIHLHPNDKAIDADAVFEDARLLGDEIARRWNDCKKAESELARLRAIIGEMECEESETSWCKCQVCRGKGERWGRGMKTTKNDFLIVTSFDGDSIISTIRDPMDQVIIEVFKLKEKGIRDALIKLGWTPPPGKDFTSSSIPAAFPPPASPQPGNDCNARS